MSYLTTRLRILFVGDDLWWSNSGSYLRGFRKLGHDVAFVDQFSNSRSLLVRLGRKLDKRTFTRTINQDLWQTFIRFKPHLIFVWNGHYVSPTVLSRIRDTGGTLIFEYCTEDPLNPNAISPFFLQGIPLYDCLFTIKAFNVKDFQSAGAQQVEYVPAWFDPDIHYPVRVAQAEQALYGSDVVFVGTWFRDRARKLEELLESRFPYSLAIWGNRWEHSGSRSPLRKHVKYRAVLGEEMSKVISASKIALGFLNAENRDQHTGRTFEIPACGGFILAERTDDHLKLFEEGKEAEYFDNVVELREKVDYYLRHNDERQRIAQAGHHRALESGYTVMESVRRVMQVFQEMANSRYS